MLTWHESLLSIHNLMLGLHKDYSRVTIMVGMGSGYFLGILLTDIDVNEPDDQTGVLDVDRP